MIKRYITIALTCVALWGATAAACTSAIVSAKANPEGRTLLWKNRDTGHEYNFVERVPASGRHLGYVALFNGGDSLLAEAWIGMNEAGFAVMNTASYNLAPDTASYKDREGYIMTEALRHCHSLADFEHLLDSLPKPLGVQANFGAIDATGNGAYYETDDYRYVKYDVADEPSGVLIRTNFSYSEAEAGGMGFVRHGNARDLIQPYIDARQITPEVLTEHLSRSYYHSIRRDDAMADTVRYVPDHDFIPRYTTSASVVIESALPSEPKAAAIMWTTMGYPPCSSVLPVTLYNVPYGLRPHGTEFCSLISEYMVSLKHDGLFKTIDGTRYVNLDIVRSVDDLCRQNSAKSYQYGRKCRQSLINSYNYHR